MASNDGWKETPRAVELKPSDLRFNSGVAALVADVNDATLRAWKRQGWYVPAAELLGQVKEGRRVPYQLADVVLLRVMVLLLQGGLSPQIAWRAIRLEAGVIIQGGRWLVLPRFLAREQGTPVETGLSARVVSSREDVERVLVASRGACDVMAELPVVVDLEKVRRDAEESLVRTWASLVRLGEDPETTKEGE